MKKLLIACVLCLVSYAGFSQLTIQNNTGFPLTVFLQSTTLPSGCAGLFEGSFLVPISGITLPYTMGNTDTYRIGVMTNVSNPAWMGWSACEFIVVNEGCPAGGGDFNFIWNGCNYVEIYP